ncbi:hypothetical protein BBK36DRAFT_1128725 [Trichoderma citrinoviride]|uniref:Uncharacterized protein n=1 Tax=Trichoderma citrinoviride TaxID=58853 RepID=A0A2T4AZW0_9HYPO|nr:hypothetical protein BBK36DRAFT_1128725 [Trichoderma citrinoviride]PTB62609.1 hypothetical protein BBK36DRAFT_1128725 [Trichoderma citrinoviride]
MEERRAECLSVYGKEIAKPANPPPLKHRFLTSGHSRRYSSSAESYTNFEVLNRYAHNAGRVTVLRSDLRFLKARMQNPSLKASLSEASNGH